MEDKNTKIFNAISLLITNTDFINCQLEFYKKHIGTFTGTDENKHEYTQIYEAYIQILEVMIEIELQKTVSNEDIKAFYEDFKVNLKKYEELNMTTVDTLYSFVDFDQFKIAILKFKDDYANANTTESPEEPDQPNFKIDQEAYERFHKEDVNDPASGWV